MQTMAEIFQGAIALEYHETLMKLQAAEKYGDKKKPKKDEQQTCGGAGCTTQAANLPCEKGGKNETCSVKKKKAARTFQPMVPGWSEPPAARV
jgi:hypothetical protein